MNKESLNNAAGAIARIIWFIGWLFIIGFASSDTVENNC